MNYVNYEYKQKISRSTIYEEYIYTLYQIQDIYMKHMNLIWSVCTILKIK